MHEATAKRRTLRALLRREETLIMPGGFSPLLAKIAERAGFESYFLAGSQLSAFLYGDPDTGIVGMRDVVDHARHIAAQTTIPLLVDFDTGFGNAVNAWFAVQECVRAGAAALQIEDQESPKKSGTSAGRACISRAEAVGKYRAAIDARNQLDSEFVVVARCDALGAAGEDFDSALARCIAYVEEGGADAVWLNSAQSREQLETACRRIPAPVITIWGGQGPPPAAAEYQSLGVRCVLYPVIASAAGMQAAWRVLHDFRACSAEALSDWAAWVKSSPYGAADLKELSGLARIRSMEEQFMPADAQRDYESTWGHAGPLDQAAVPPKQ